MGINTRADEAKAAQVVAQSSADVATMTTYAAVATPPQPSEEKGAYTHDARSGSSPLGGNDIISNVKALLKAQTEHISQLLQAQNEIQRLLKLG